MLGGGGRRLLVSGRRTARAPGLRVREQNLLLVEGVGEAPVADVAGNDGVFVSRRDGDGRRCGVVSG